MNTLILILIFVFGTAIGSFLNAYIFRFRTGYSMWDRSQCPVCGKTLVWYELIPVLSFLMLRGRCRECASTISWQYPLVEVAAGGWMLGVYLKTGVTLESLLVLIAGWIFIAIAVYDIRHTIIPAPWSYTTIALGVFSAFISGNAFSTESIGVHILSACALFLFFYAIWFFSDGRAMGGGDAKLAAAIGLLLSPAAAVSAIIYGFWAGAVLSLIWMGVNRFGEKKGRKVTMKTEVPFGPYLIAGFFFVFFSGTVLF